MRLISCHIENFGNLHNFEMDFENGLNIIRQNNGWGKSTLATFLRVMFYGFGKYSNKSKQNLLTNERKRFKPWQGGIYGGKLIFEINRKKYILTRIFQDKEIEDIFELRDAVSNLISSDYDQNIGEEIFGINNDSFLRTVFICQNDSFTYSTDDIASKIGRFVDNSDDLCNYETAIKNLTDKINSLSPTRATGSICRRQNEITAYERVIRDSEVLYSSVKKTETKLENEKEKLKSLRMDYDKSILTLNKVSKKKADDAVNEEWKRLKSELDDRKTLLEHAKENFSGAIPSMEDIRTILPVSHELKAKENEISSYMLSVDEQNALTSLENYFENGIPTEDTIKTYFNKCSELKKYEQDDFTVKTDKNTNSSLKNKKKFSISFIIFGILLLLAGLFLFILNITSEDFPAYIPAIPVFLGIMFLLYGIITKNKLLQKHISTEEKAVSDSLREDILSFIIPYEHRLDKTDVSAEACYNRIMLLENRRIKYSILSEKEQRYDRTVSEYSVIKQKIEIFLKRYGFTLEEKPDLQLLKIRDMADDYYDAQKHYSESYEKLKKFEKDKKESLLNSNDESLPSENDAEASVHKISIDMDIAKENISSYEHQLNNLREGLDELEENLDTLRSLKEKQAEETNIYKWTSIAKESLIKAKEAMTSRYVEPLLQNFKKYYSFITSTDPKVIHMDANTHISIDESGLQRDAELFSTGYKDLIGTALRISFVEAMYTDEIPFLIMDDPFVNLDDEKICHVKRFLETLSDKFQIIYFTCSSSR